VVKITAGGTVSLTDVPTPFIASPPEGTHSNALRVMPEAPSHP
jgi:hypothetical protein